MLAYYLAVYPDVQSRLQDEIDDLMESKEEGEELTQEDITSMTYLEQVLLMMMMIMIAMIIITLLSSILL